MANPQYNSNVQHLVCAVMAGGSGTRFWPLSRASRPKQLLKLLDDTTLLRATHERITPVCPAERQLVITNRRLVDDVSKVIPELPAGHIIGEPTARNTAPCMALAAIAAEQIDPDAILVLLPADHHVAEPDAFRATLAVAAEQAAAGHIVTLGIRPSHPETGYGYIELADRVDATEAYEVARFVEKPDRETAAAFLVGGMHLWNCGVFVLRADIALAAIEEHLPAVASALSGLRRGDMGRFSSNTFLAELDTRFAQCPSISIDHGVMEHAQGLRCIPLSAGWSDVGSWRSLLDQRAQGQECFVRGDVITLDCERTVAIGEGVTVAVVGTTNLAVIATKDAVLAIDLDHSQDVRTVVKTLAENDRNNLL